MMPKTGSTVCLRNAQAVRPAWVCNLCDVRSAGELSATGGHRFGNPFQRWLVVAFLLDGDVRINAGLFAGCYIRGAEITGVGQQYVGFAQRLRQCGQLRQHRLDLFLVVTALSSFISCATSRT